MKFLCVQLQQLQKEKSARLHSNGLHKVLEFVSTVHDLFDVLGLEFYTTMTEIHPRKTSRRWVMKEHVGLG
ncbi:65-kDa microtubule-associated protein 1 [Tanacetum coccineum]